MITTTTPTHATVQYGQLYLNGKIIELGNESVTIKVNQVKGMDTGTVYDRFLRGLVLAFPKIDCDLYR